jgi:hypothetical protein
MKPPEEMATPEQSSFSEGHCQTRRLAWFSHSTPEDEDLAICRLQGY